MTVTARLSITLTIDNTETDQHYAPRPTAFKPEVIDGSGPIGGMYLVPVSGIDIDLSAIESPGGLLRIQNFDTENYVEVGAWDGALFYPLFEVGPGEFYVYRLARNLGHTYGSGTGTSGVGVPTLRLNANQNYCRVLVEAFNK